jgi:hypothetical protein
MFEALAPRAVAIANLQIPQALLLMQTGELPFRLAPSSRAIF